MWSGQKQGMADQAQVNNWMNRYRIAPASLQNNLGGLYQLCYNKSMKNNSIILLVGIVGLAALFTMLLFVSPTEIGPFGVLLFFTTIYVVCFCISSLLFQSFKKLAFKKPYLGSKDYLYSAIFAFGPIMLLMARSFGVISPWTVSLDVLFVCLAEFLAYKKA